MNYSRQQIESLKQTSIVNYLHSLGFEPVGTSGGQLVYYSPFTEEHTPSFFVHPGKNVFKCFNIEEKGGDIIQLVSLLEKLDFKPALERLESFNNQPNSTFLFSCQSICATRSQTRETSTLTLLDERALFNDNLVKYVTGRGIPLELARRYLHEVRYRNGNREYYAVGFKTDKDSYAIRSKAFKGWLGSSAIRTLPIAGSTSVDVFEGFFDFLSALTYERLFRPGSTTIVLNSTTNLNQALATLEGAQTVNCYFDNDKAGQAAITKLRALQLPVNDCSGLYERFNDFNEMLLSKPV